MVGCGKGESENAMRGKKDARVMDARERERDRAQKVKSTKQKVASTEAWNGSMRRGNKGDRIGGREAGCERE